ncbi:hypothetical protein KAX17_15595 [Candidatus Bipolaricaulota bacterium]|nr:hypothetical protein [Candidatus Bipolaricaulota bacterium]
MLIPAEGKDSIQVRLPQLSGISSYLVRLDTGTEMLLPRSKTKFRWSLHGRHFNDSNVAVIYIVDKKTANCTEIGEIEILRQTEDDLKKKFNFIHQDGYLLVGRNTFELRGVSENLLPCVDNRDEMLIHLIEAEREKLRNIFPSLAQPEIPDYETYQLIDNLSEVLRSLYSRLNPSGPSSLVQGVKSPTRILSSITEEKATLQCTGTRDLFIDLVISSRVLSVENIRKIDALRYEPVPGIVVNGHSLLEVSID